VFRQALRDAVNGEEMNGLRCRALKRACMFALDARIADFG
jgi:hypothetical protein